MTTELHKRPAAHDRHVRAGGVEHAGLAIVGAGYREPNLRSALRSRTMRLVAVCDMDVASARKVAGAFAGVDASGDADDVLADPGVEAIAVATPAATRFEVALAAIEAGKHVLVEKPLASTCEERRALLRAAEDRGVVLMCDHTYCYTPAVQRIRKVVETGTLGDIQYVDSLRIKLGLVQRDIDVLRDLAPQDLSILDFVLPDGCALSPSRRTGRPDRRAPGLRRLSLPPAAGGRHRTRPRQLAQSGQGAVDDHRRVQADARLGRPQSVAAHLALRLRRQPRRPGGLGRRRPLAAIVSYPVGRHGRAGAARAGGPCRASWRSSPAAFAPGAPAARTAPRACASSASSRRRLRAWRSTARWSR